jgi:hypothetical protein
MATLEVPINLTKPGLWRYCQPLQAKQIVGEIAVSQTNEKPGKHNNLLSEIYSSTSWHFKFSYHFSPTLYVQKRARSSSLKKRIQASDFVKGTLAKESKTFVVSAIRNCNLQPCLMQQG